jgi:hypothetical protein
VRPKTIIYFERIIFGTLLLAVLRGWLTWDQGVGREATTLGRSSSFAAAFTLASLTLILVLFGTLTLLVSITVG